MSRKHEPHGHWHPGIYHLHPHRHREHGVDLDHHGPAFGKLSVTEVEPTSEAIASVLLDEPVDLGLIRDLKASIEWARAKRRDENDN